jgi:adenylate cyclase
MGITFTHQGECARTLEHFDKALLLYDPDRHGEDAFLYAPNPGVAMRCFAAWALWFLGRPDQALERIEDALALARELSEPHGLAHALLFSAILHQLRREEQAARQQSDAAIAVSIEHGLVLYEAMATTTRGWALVEEGRAEEAIEQMRQGLAALQITGAQLLRPHFLALLAGALEKVGDASEAIRVLDEALTTAEAAGEGFYLAELYRLKGEQLLAHASPGRLAHAGRPKRTVVAVESAAASAAEPCFQQALEIARRQKSRSLELRAAMSLVRLHHGQARQQATLDLLEEIYRSFGEGFGTADLREAKALLDASA